MCNLQAGGGPRSALRSYRKSALSWDAYPAAIQIPMTMASSLMKLVFLLGIGQALASRTGTLNRTTHRRLLHFQTLPRANALYPPLNPPLLSPHP